MGYGWRGEGSKLMGRKQGTERIEEGREEGEGR